MKPIKIILFTAIASLSVAIANPAAAQGTPPVHDGLDTGNIIVGACNGGKHAKAAQAELADACRIKLQDDSEQACLAVKGDPHVCYDLVGPTPKVFPEGEEPKVECNDSMRNIAVNLTVSVPNGWEISGEIDLRLDIETIKTDIKECTATKKRRILKSGSKSEIVNETSDTSFRLKFEGTGSATLKGPGITFTLSANLQCDNLQNIPSYRTLKLGACTKTPSSGKYGDDCSHSTSKDDASR